MLIYSKQKLKQLGMRNGLFCITDVELSVDKKEPKVSRIFSGTWQPHIIPHKGKQIARFADDYVGTGRRKKQMPCCNGMDTSKYLARNRAHVRLAFHCKIICRTEIMGESK